MKTLNLSEEEFTFVLSAMKDLYTDLNIDLVRFRQDAEKSTSAHLKDYCNESCRFIWYKLNVLTHIIRQLEFIKELPSQTN